MKMSKIKPNFLRRDWNKKSKLGKGRKNKQKWKRPTGRDNKMREKRKGYPATVSIGYKNPKKEREMIFVINSQKDISDIPEKTTRITLGKVGKKKKIQILEKAKKKKIEIENINIEKFLKNNKIKGDKK